MRFARAGALVLALAATATACRSGRPEILYPETPAGRWYVLGPTETLEGVAREAGVPPEDILELNGIQRADAVPGKLIFVMAPAVAAPPPAAVATVGAMAMRWPLDERPLVVGSPFGARGGRAHDGIDLPAPTGTPVYAAASGRVIYAGDSIRGYGNLVVMQHAGDLLTVYAHNSALLVREGDIVGAGQRVALVGHSGRASGPHLHFEVRQSQIPRDPMLYLPAITAGAKTAGPRPAP